MKKYIKQLFVLVLLLNFSSCGYNKLVNYQEGITQSWATVETAYAERADAAVKYLTALKTDDTVQKSDVSALEKALSEIEALKIPKDDLSPQAIQDFMKKQDELSQVLRSAMSSSSTQNTVNTNNIELALNKIRNARKKFNDAVGEYNTYKRQFPQSITASPMGFDNYEPLKMDEGSRQF